MVLSTVLLFTCHSGQFFKIAGDSQLLGNCRTRKKIPNKLSVEGFTAHHWVKTDLGRVRLGSIRNKNNWNNASKHLFGNYSHSGIPELPFRLFYSQEQNSRIYSGIYSGINSYSGISQTNAPLDFSSSIPEALQNSYRQNFHNMFCRIQHEAYEVSRLTNLYLFIFTKISRSIFSHLK